MFLHTCTHNTCKLPVHINALMQFVVNGCVHVLSTHLKLSFTHPASKARSSYPEDRLLLCIQDGKPGVHKAAVLLNIAYHSTRRRLHFNLLQTAEAQARHAPVRSNKVDDLQLCNGRGRVPLMDTGVV